MYFCINTNICICSLSFEIGLDCKLHFLVKAEPSNAQLDAHTRAALIETSVLKMV